MSDDDDATAPQDVPNPLADFLEAARKQFGAPPRPEGIHAPSVSDSIHAFLPVEVLLLFAVGAIRQWNSTLDAVAKLLPTLDLTLAAVDRDAPGSFPAREELIQELRVSLRSLTAMSCQESRRTLAFLERASEQLGPRAAPADETDEYWRRWSVKP